MSTLISVYSSDGCEGRCDAKCYEARHPNCDCVCRGANHGVGLAQAAANTQLMAEEWLEDWRRQHSDASGQLGLGLIVEGALCPS